MKRARYSREPLGRFVQAVETWNGIGEGTRPYIDIASIDREGKTIIGTTFITRENAPSRARQEVREGDVLVSTVRPNLNAVAMVPQTLDRAIASTGFCVLRSDPAKLDNRYLYHWVRTADFIEQMVRVATGASYPAVSDRLVKDSMLPLPPLAEQRRIADILDKADAIRRKRREAVTTAGELPHAWFIDLFGQPHTNSKGWPVRVFSDVCDSRLGKMLDAKQQTGAHARPYLRNLNVQWGRLDLSSIFEMDFDEEDRREFRLQPGDVMICEGGAGVGQTAIWRGELPECYFQKSLHRVRPDQTQAVPEYIAYLIWMLMRTHSILGSISQATIPHLTGVKLKSLQVPVPPLAPQRRFADLLASHTAVLKRLEAAAFESDNLFHSLVQRAFRGEL